MSEIWVWRGEGDWRSVCEPRFIPGNNISSVLSNYEDKRPAFTPDYTRSLWRLPAENKTPARLLLAATAGSENLAHTTSKPTSNSVKTWAKTSKMFQDFLFRVTKV